MPRVLVACEFSGVVRDAFLDVGIPAVSVDLDPNDSPFHMQGDVLELLDRDQDWDLVIAHPPCTYLANSGVRHLHSVPSRKGTLPKVHGPARWKAMKEAANFFNKLKDFDCPRICVENPIPHGYAREIIGKYTQLIQPWQYGHGETKATCLWLKGLPNLEPTEIVDGRVARIHLMSPGKDRQKQRSVTFSGIAKAMADQWGPLLC